MTSWLMGIVGVVFLGVLFDLIYPSGKTNAFCRSIFGVLSVIMIITPILNINIDEMAEEDLTSVTLIENINKSKGEALRLKIISNLESCGVSGAIVEIDINMNNNEFEIENIYIDTTNLVLTENVTNINKYEVISNKVAEVASIERSKIIVYG